MLVRTSRRTKTANIAKDEVSSASHRQIVTISRNHSSDHSEILEEHAVFGWNRCEALASCLGLLQYARKYAKYIKSTPPS